MQSAEPVGKNLTAIQHVEFVLMCAGKKISFISLFSFIASLIRFPFVSAMVRINGFYNYKGN
jgi:hypothetical protein